MDTQRSFRETRDELLSLHQFKSLYTVEFSLPKQGWLDGCQT
jgi:hypothetical protein